MFECGWVTQPFVHPAVWFHLTLHGCHGRDGGNLGMSPGLRKCLSGIYHPKGWPGQAGKALQHPRSCCSAWQRRPAAPPGAVYLQGPAPVPGAEGSWQPSWCFFAQQSHGLLLYLVLPPLLSIVFLVQLDLPATTSPRKGEGPHSGEPPTLCPQGLPQTSQQLRNINSTC